MSKVVFKSNYSKPSKGGIGNYVEYIAKREGVDKSINTKIEINVNYIATRPRVVKVGEHGLFGLEDDVNIDKVKEEVKHHDGNIWQPIISLRREDAQRLGYDNPKAWRNLILSKQYEMAKAYHIPIDNLVWYAAFHNEGDHPHVHMIVYSKEKCNEHLTPKGCDNLRNSFIKTIFKDELKQEYDYRQSLRDRIIEEAEKYINDYDFQERQPPNDFQNAYMELKFSLENYKGKKGYKYLPSDTKDKLNKLVKIVCADDNIQNLYTKWCEVQLAILKYYYKNPKECFGEIYENKDINKRIQNKILKAVLKNEMQDLSDDEIYDSIYGDVVYSLCKMFDSLIDTTIKEGHSKSIVDSRERLKIAKHKESLGIKMEM